ncbi:M60 family metallopeptidase [Listeria cornellensis]|uniref:M60 family metallopeptidase n=1 Tax=Listeria cornellensis TaxID=1494961 RepID=UPI0004B636AD|nr:M60 family metallopeptidase [Listeria cornellensis]
MPEFSSVSKLIEYYTDVFETYNKLAGISFTPVNQTDKNIPNKYFIKANLHGIGYAYYSDGNTGQNDSSLQAYLGVGWTILHEIAHGYQGGFMEQSSLDVDEVWNNTYAEYYERKYYGADYPAKGTQTANGDKEIREASLNESWQEEHKAFNSWSGSDKERILYLFMQKGGEEGFINFNQEYRKLANTTNFVKENYDLFDLMSKYYGEASGFDFTPVIESVEGTTSQALQQDTEYKNRKAVASLKELVSASELANAQKKLNLESYLSFVDTDQMAELHLNGEATIKLNIDDFSQIEGQDLIVKNGAKVVKQVKVTAQVLNLGTLPKGIYTVYAPTGNSQKYTIDQRYLKVQNDENTLNMKYTPKKNEFFHKSS